MSSAKWRHDDPASMCWGCVATTYRADSRFAHSQWETSLQSNALSHWMGANLESAKNLLEEPPRVHPSELIESKCARFVRRVWKSPVMVQSNRWFMPNFFMLDLYREHLSLIVMMRWHYLPHSWWFILIFLNNAVYCHGVLIRIMFTAGLNRNRISDQKFESVSGLVDWNRL